jgi:SAM-dependent methyltransferase
MLLKELLSVEEDVSFIESGYEKNTRIGKSLRLLHNIASELSQLPSPVRAGMILVRDSGGVYALALYNPAEEGEGAFWAVFTSILDVENQKRFEQLAEAIRERVLAEGVRNIEIEPSRFVEAMREYYSLKLLREAERYPVNLEFVYNKSRVERLKKIIKQLEETRGLDLSGRVLEICCGNGMATAALHELEIRPLCVDNDAYSIFEGLASRVLAPERTIVADATGLTSVLQGEELDAAVGFMLGDIDEFNKAMWEQILLETVRLTKRGGSLFFTLRTESEAQFVGDVLRETARGEVLCPDESEALYDRWVYVGEKN